DACDERADDLSQVNTRQRLAEAEVRSVPEAVMATLGALDVEAVGIVPARWVTVRGLSREVHGVAGLEHHTEPLDLPHGFAPTGTERRVEAEALLHRRTHEAGVVAHGTCLVGV